MACLEEEAEGEAKKRRQVNRKKKKTTDAKMLGVVTLIHFCLLLNYTMLNSNVVSEKMCTLSHEL